MRKTFPLHADGRDDLRVLEAVKLELRKYVKRERRKRLPDGADLWEFACKVGPDPMTAAPLAVDEVVRAVEAAAVAGAAAVYVEILAAPGKRPPRPAYVPGVPVVASAAPLLEGETAPAAPGVPAAENSPSPTTDSDTAPDPAR